MTAKELMKRRFQLIADFPNNHYGKTGTVLDRNWSRYPNDDENLNPIWSISDFPHLFKELKWFEQRKKEEMPKKLICKAIQNDTEIMEIEEWDMEIMVGWTNKEKRECCSLLSFTYEYGYFPID